VSYRAIFATYCVLFVAYSINVYTLGTDAPHIEPMSEQGQHGKQLFRDHNCVACHQFYGLGGYMGPDLTNVISNRGPAYARAFIASGTRSMPNFGLNDEELDALVTFLEFVDQTGRYPAEDYDVTWFGTVAETGDSR
jgi:nitric oxide reductase subunit C